MRLTFTIPARGILARGRAPQYISPSTTQAVITVNAGAPQEFSLSPAGPNCQTANGGTACNLTVAAPIGASDTFAVALEDANADVLSAGTFAAAIAEGVANVTLPLVLGGVPHTLDIASSNSAGTIFTLGSGTQTATLVTTIKDAAGDILIGNEPFTNASGSVTPLTITGSNASTIEYAVEPLGGSFGSPSQSVTLNAPSDTLETAYTGSGVPPGYDTLTYAPATVTSARYGTNTPNLGVGVAWQAPFVPLLIAPIGADVAAGFGVPHTAVVSDGYSHLAIVGGADCTLNQSPYVGTVSSIAIDSGATPADAAVYTIANSGGATYFLGYSIANLNTGTCPTYSQTNYSPNAAPGIVRAASGDIVYFVPSTAGSYPAYLYYAASTNPDITTGGVTDMQGIGALTMRFASHIFACGNYAGSNTEVEEFELPLTSTPTKESYDVTTGTSTCAGIAIDDSDGRLITDNIGGTIATRLATFPVSAPDAITQSGTTVIGTQSTDYQSAAVGNWFQSQDFFINASDGIEIYNENPAITEQGVIDLANSALSSAVTSGTIEGMMYGDDQRLWVTLSSGYVVGIPTY